MVPYDDYEQVAIADLPGLIPGSHKNYGLGIQFLQHVERCRGLIFLLDATASPLQQYRALTHELRRYNPALLARPACVALNKLDVPAGARAHEEVRRQLDVIGLSAKSGHNLQALLRALRNMYDGEASTPKT